MRRLKRYIDMLCCKRIAMNCLFLGLTPPAGCAVWTQIWEREDLIAFASSYHSMLGLELLCWIQVGPCWIHVGATWSSVGITSAHVRSKLGLGWPILGLCWGYGSLKGSMLAHFEVLLGLCWLIWALCWGQVRPSGAMLVKKALPSGRSRMSEL